MATRFNNSGFPQPTGIRACTRHHERALSSYKVRKNGSLAAAHRRALAILQDMMSSDKGHRITLKKLYCELEVAQCALLEIVPVELLSGDNSLNEQKVHQQDLTRDLAATR